MFKRWMVLILLAGCYDAHPKSGELTCAADGECPRGFHCAADNRCYEHPPDLAVTGGETADLAFGDAGRPDGFCNQPCVAPADTCGDGGLVHVSAAKSCDVNGDCVFTTGTEPCDNSRPPMCTGSVESDFQPGGSCGAGDGGAAACQYPSTQKSCPQGCAPTGDVCLGDPCAGSNCASQTPSNSCNGLTLTRYALTTCDGTSGSAMCQQHQTVSDCSGTNPCIAYGCDTSAGCTTSNKSNFVNNCSSPTNGFCLNGACTARVVSVSVTPATANVHVGDPTNIYGSSVSNNSQDSTAVTWSLSPVGATSGSLTMAMANVVQYLPPATPPGAAVSVIATSAVDATKSGTATLTIYPAISVSALTVGSSNLHVGKTTTVSATISNLSPSDSGNGVFSATSGSLSATTCVPAGATSTCSAIYTAPAAAGSDTVTLTSSDAPGAANSATLTIFAAISISAADAGVHVGKTLAYTFTINNLAPADGGSATLASTQGTFNSLSCTKVGGTSTCNVNYAAEATPSSVTVTITSSDDAGVTATATFTVEAAVTITISQTTVDLLAFATPEESATVTVTVNNLLAGESAAVNGSLNGATAIVTFTQGTPASIAIHIPTDYDVGAVTAQPAPTVITVTSAANAAATGTITVNIHAWIDESAALAAKLSGVAGLYSVGMNGSGDVLVGGESDASPPAPRVAARSHTNNTWSAAWQPIGSNGAVSSITAAADGSFMAAGLLGAPDTNANQPLLLQHWATPPSGTPTNLVTSAAMVASDVLHQRPRIAILSGFKYLGYNVGGNGCANGSKDNALIVYDANNNLDDPIASAANHFPYGADVGGAPANGDSCPFSPVATSTAMTGLVMNSGGQLWLGGFADCGLASGGQGCTTQSAGNDGLASVTIGTSAWRSSWADMVGAGVQQPVLGHGYDDSLLAVGGLVALTGHNCNVLYYQTGIPAGAAGSAVLANTTDEGLAIGGSATGGAPWAGTQRDLFISHENEFGGIARFSWISGTTERVITLPAGKFIEDIVVVKKTNGGYEGYAVGIATNNSTGALTGPLVYHLL